MNTNPQAKVVLCYGDSNTRGSRPDSPERYLANVRWTGQLQEKLGSDFYIIEEGLGGRTTNLESPDPRKPGRSGLPYFVTCTQSHYPYDLVIIMLGTNDLKDFYDRSITEVANVLAEYCDVVREYNQDAQILLVSPSHITAVEPIVFYNEVSAQKSKKLAAEIRRIADEKNAYFFDASEVAVVGDDGLHWDVESEGRFAGSIEKMVREIL